MSPIVENLSISFATGIVAAAGAVQASPSNQIRDWVLIGAVGISAAALAFINGARQLHKEPPEGS